MSFVKIRYLFSGFMGGWAISPIRDPSPTLDPTLKLACNNVTSSQTERENSLQCTITSDQGKLIDQVSPCPRRRVKLSEAGAGVTY